MGWIDTEVIRQCKDLAMNILVEMTGTALLEISASTSPNQKCIPSEDTALLLDHIAHAAIGVSRSGQGIYHMGAEIYAISLLQVTICLGSTGCGNYGLTTRQFPQPSAARNVIRVHVGVDF